MLKSSGSKWVTRLYKKGEKNLYQWEFEFQKFMIAPVREAINASAERNVNDMYT